MLNKIVTNRKQEYRDYGENLLKNILKYKNILK